MKTIDHFYSYRTYSGCLEGPPMLDSIYKSIHQEIKKLWGDRPVFIVSPEIGKIKDSFREMEMLPSWTHFAWVSGPAKDQSGDGSHLVIVWFSEESCFNHYDETISSVDWDKHAEDFEF